MYDKPEARYCLDCGFSGLGTMTNNHPSAAAGRVRAEHQNSTPGRAPALGLIAALAAAKLVAHLATVLLTPYGFHRDEFLYLAMGHYLHLWHLFFPPAIAVLANAARGLFGDSLFAIRLFPALAGTVILVLAALTARELGGNRSAQGLAALAVLLSPLFLRAAALFAAGALAIERSADHPVRLPFLGPRGGGQGCPRSGPSGRWTRVLGGVIVVLMAVFGLLALPFGLPILPPESMARYAAALGVKSAVTSNRGVVLPLPQDYADMLGWEEQVAAVARVFHALPPDQRARAIVLAGNYGEAGAIDFFGPRHGLPRAVASSGGYWYFGPGDKPGEVAVGLGLESENLTPYFRSVMLVAHFDDPWLVPEQQHNPIVVAESPYRSMQEIWPSLKAGN